MKTKNTQYRIARGAYITGSNDLASRWYIETITEPVDRSGTGYRTKALAKQALAVLLTGGDVAAMPRD
jgi:hypothetical protein